MKDRGILISNRLMLVRQLKITEELLSCLLVDSTLTPDMKQQVEAEKTDSDKAGTLLDILMKRADSAFDRFVYALVETHQDGLATTLSKDKAEAYIVARNESRPLPVPSPNPPIYSQSVFQEEQFRQYVNQFISSGAAAAAAYLPGNPTIPSLPGALVAQPHDGNDATDSKIEVKNALEEIMGDCAKGNMTIDIQLCRSFDMINSDKVYKMSRLPRGRVLIINNYYFTGDDLGERKGAQFDRDNLKELFEKLSFDVEILKNQSSVQIKEIVKKESQNPSHNDADMFILFILSHGCQGNVYGSDGKTVSIEDDIAFCFSPDKCPALAGKPKVFFIQACQGVSRGRVYESDGIESDDKTQLEETMADLKRQDDNDFVPGYFRNSDTVMSYATIKGYLAWRETKLGSWFVRCLVYVFSRQAHSDHLMDMLTEVNSLLSKLKTSGKEGDNCGQLAEKSDTLLKKLYFFPGADARKECSLPK